MKIMWLAVAVLMAGVAPDAGAQGFDVKAGPIWNNNDAKAKCKKVARSARWNGQWKTTVQGKMSVCGCAVGRVARVARNVKAGPIWNNGDAKAKCARACGRLYWSGHWKTIVQGRMSVCNIRVKPLARRVVGHGKRNVKAGPIWNNSDAKGKCNRIAASSHWTGQWKTVVRGRKSVCECSVGHVARTKMLVAAGPVWNNQHAKKRCPRVCRKRVSWTGQWRTTVQGKMSVCEIRW